MASPPPPREIDFFAMEKKFQQLVRSPGGRLTIRDIHKAAARMDPSLLRTVINSRPPPLSAVAASPAQESSRGGDMAPLTIFYNGVVCAYDVPRRTAEVILELAEKVQSPPVAAEHDLLLAGAHRHRGYKMLIEDMNAEGDLPLCRKRSLQRFLEKRRERLTCFSPYPPSSASSSTTSVQWEENFPVHGQDVDITREKNNNWSLTALPTRSEILLA